MGQDGTRWFVWRCRALIIEGDVRDLSETIASRTIDAFGRLDVWVHNVGGSDDKTTMGQIDTPDEVFRSQLELNLMTAFRGARRLPSEWATTARS